MADHALVYDCTGHAEWRAAVSDGLRLRARHIRSITDGEFTPSPPPSLLAKLTDELLVIAADVVEAVGAESKHKALLRNGVFRLLDTYVQTLEAELERVNPDWRTVCVRVQPVRCGMCCTTL